MITAAVLGGANLFGGVGQAFGAVVGSTLVQMVQSGMVFVGVNLYLQPMVLAAIIFLAVMVEAVPLGQVCQAQAAHAEAGLIRAARCSGL